MADRENVQMAGDYEIMQSFRMGGTTMLIGYNPGDATYMTGFQEVPSFLKGLQKLKERGEAR